MFGFFIAALSAGGLILIAKRRHYRGPTGWALRRLDASPAQEKVIREATGEMRDAFRDFRKVGRESKQELADALRQDAFERPRIEAWINARKAELDQLSERLVRSAEEVHTTLDSEQREKLSRWIERSVLHHRHHRHC
jgi:Spy/CpxP family protein refolding chaperone